MDMEELLNFLQLELSRDFGYSDDQVIESLQVCIDELRRAKLLLPPRPADDSEQPKKPFGLFVPPSVEQVIGRRTLESHSDLIQGRRRSSNMNTTATTSSTTVVEASTSGSGSGGGGGGVPARSTRKHTNLRAQVSHTSDVSAVVDGSINSSANTSMNASLNSRAASARDSTGYQTSLTSAWDSQTPSAATSLERSRPAATSRFNSTTTDDVFHSPDESASFNDSRDSNRTPTNSTSRRRSANNSMNRTPTPSRDASVIQEFAKLSQQMDSITAEVSSITVKESRRRSGGGSRGASTGGGSRGASTGGGSRGGSKMTNGSNGAYVKRVQRKEESPSDKSDYDNLHSSFEQTIDVTNGGHRRGGSSGGGGGVGADSRYPMTYTSHDDGITVIPVNGGYSGDSSNVPRSRSDYGGLRSAAQKPTQRSYNAHNGADGGGGGGVMADQLRRGEGMPRSVSHSHSPRAKDFGQNNMYNGYTKGLTVNIQKQSAYL